jgi:hypothetical protein
VPINGLYARWRVDLLLITAEKLDTTCGIGGYLQRKAGANRPEDGVQ